MERISEEADRKDAAVGDVIGNSDDDVERQPATDDVTLASVDNDGDDACDGDASGSREASDSDAVRKAIQSFERAVRRYRMLLSRTLQLESSSLAEGNRCGTGSRKSTTLPDRMIRQTGSRGSPAKTRSDKVIVYMRVVFLKIGEIDTLKEHFTADAFIQASWREPLLDINVEKDERPAENVEWSAYWNPNLFVANNLGEPKETSWQTANYNSAGEATVCERRRIRGCFLENLELGEFPFDTQDLTLTITTERSESELDFEEDTMEISSINVQSFVDEQEWELHSHVETWKPSAMPSKVYQTSKHKHPSFSASCRASRRPGFFIWNIFLVMLFICSLTFSTFAVDLALPQNRLQLAFILLLTTISFKFVVCQTLPQISYLTYLDKYILTSMAILCSVCIWHAVVSILPNIYGVETALKTDRWGLIVFGSAYFLFHVLFCLYIYLVALHKRWMYNKKDKEHRERIKRLQVHSEVHSCDRAAAHQLHNSVGDSEMAPIASIDSV